MKLHRILAALVTAAILLAGCGGASSDATNPNYADLDFGDSDSAVVSAPGGPTAVVAIATDPVPATAVDETTRDDLIAIYDRFLDLRSAAVISAGEVADLTDVATQPAMDQVAGLRAESSADHAEDKYSAMTGLVEWSNVTTIHERESGFVFTDCTERQELNSIGIPHSRFVTNEVVLVPTDGTYKIDQVTEVHGGLFAAFVGDFGCVPPSFIERAETVAALAITEVAAMTADPARFVADGVPETFTDDARDELTYIVDLLNEQGLTRTADESIEIKVIGMDTNKPDFTVVVSVCRYFPDGRSYTNAATGETTQSDLARGSSEEEWLFVQLEGVPRGTPATDTVIRVEAKSSNCWAG